MDFGLRRRRLSRALDAALRGDIAYFKGQRVAPRHADDIIQHLLGVAGSRRGSEEEQRLLSAACALAESSRSNAVIACWTALAVSRMIGLVGAPPDDVLADERTQRALTLLPYVVENADVRLPVQEHHFQELISLLRGAGQLAGAQVSLAPIILDAVERCQHLLSDFARATVWADVAIVTYEVPVVVGKGHILTLCAALERVSVSEFENPFWKDVCGALVARAGQCYYDLQDFAAAITITNAALRLDPKCMDAVYVAAISHFNLGDPQSALAVLSPHKESTESRILSNYAAALRAVGRHDEAKGVSAAILRTQPDHVVSLVLLALDDLRVHPISSGDLQMWIDRLSDLAALEQDVDLISMSATKGIVELLSAVVHTALQQNAAETAERILAPLVRSPNSIVASYAWMAANKLGLDWAKSSAAWRAVADKTGLREARLRLADALCGEGDFEAAATCFREIVSHEDVRGAEMRALYEAIASCRKTPSDWSSISATYFYKNRCASRAWKHASDALREGPNVEALITRGLCVLRQNVSPPFDASTPAGVVDQLTALAMSEGLTREEFEAEVVWSQKRTPDDLAYALDDFSIALELSQDPSQRAELSRLILTCLDAASFSADTFDLAIEIIRQRTFAPELKLEELVSLRDGRNRALSLMTAHEVNSAISILRANADAEVRLGLRRSASFTELLCADCLLRTDDFAEALRRLEQSETLSVGPFILGKDLVAAFEAERELLGQQDVPQAGLELECMYLLAPFYKVHRDRLLLRAVALFRQGLVKEAVSSIPNPVEFMEEFDNVSAIVDMGNIFLAAKDEGIVRKCLARLALAQDATEPRGRARALDFRFRAIFESTTRAELRELCAEALAIDGVDSTWSLTWYDRLVQYTDDPAVKRQLVQSILQREPLFSRLSPHRQAILRCNLARYCSAEGEHAAAMEQVRVSMQLMENLRRASSAAQRRGAWNEYYGDVYRAAVKAAALAGAVAEAALWSDFVRARSTTEEMITRRISRGDRSTESDQASALGALRDLLAKKEDFATLFLGYEHIRRRFPDVVPSDAREPDGDVERFTDRLKTVLKGLEWRERQEAHDRERRTTEKLHDTTAEFSVDAVIASIGQFATEANELVAVLTFMDLDDCLVVQAFDSTSRQPTMKVIQTARKEEISAQQRDELLAFIRETVPSGYWLVIIPNGRLTSEAVHAWGGSAPLLMTNPVTYFPSLAHLYQHLVSPPTERTDSHLIIADPTHSLVYAAEEAKGLSRRFGGTQVEDSGTKDYFLQLLSRPRDLVHFSGHATFDADNPLATGLVIQHGESRVILSASDILAIDLSVDTAVINGCSAGALAPAEGGDLSGFAQALLVSGVRTLLTCTAPVKDIAAMLVAEEFYRLWLDDGLPKIVAAQRAVLHLRGMGEKQLARRLSSITAMVSDRHANLAKHRSVEFRRQLFEELRSWSPFILMGGLR